MIHSKDMRFFVNILEIPLSLKLSNVKIYTEFYKTWLERQLGDARQVLLENITQ